MDQNQNDATNTHESFTHDFGTFEGFNFREQSAIGDILTADEVLNWNHDQKGEAEFWPSGDKPEVSLIFKHQTSVTATELKQLDAALQELGGDSTENYLRIYYAVGTRGASLEDLTRDGLENLIINIYQGTSFLDLRRIAACELFELYYPNECQIWLLSICPGFNFDTDQFLDSPVFHCDELTLNNQKVLLIAVR